jgi:hypothetical protein
MSDTHPTDEGNDDDKPVRARTPDSGVYGDSSLALITLTKDLEALKTRVDGLETQKKKKFYQDQSFWIGITAIPIIFASGWLLKLATDSPFLLREIHRLLGTEPALVAALDERHDALKDAIQSLNKDRAPILTALFRVGLLQERAQKLDCSRDTANEPATAKLHCEVPQNAFRNVADAPFPIGAATKVDVGILVNVIENVFGEDGYREKVTDKTTELESKELIRVAINKTELDLTPMQFSPILNGSQYARYSFPCFSFKDPEVPDLPINMLTVSISNSANHRYSISVGVLVLESRQPCGDKK